MNERQLAIYQRNYQKQQRVWERYYEKRVASALRAQMAPVIKAVEQGGVVMVDVQVRPEPIENVLSKLFYQVGLEYATTVWKQIGAAKKGESGVLKLKKDPNPQVLQFNVGPQVPPEIYSSWEQYMTNYFRTYGMEDVLNITSTTKKELNTALELAAKEGWGTEKTVRYLRKDLGSTLTRKRAKLIVRTETVTASNRAAMMSAESTGLQLNKQWSAAMQPERTREAHLLANRQNGEIPMYQDFQVGGEAMAQPGDSRASAKNRCNCRCVVVFVPIRN